MEPLIKALTQFETLMDQSREALEIISRYAREVRPGTPLDPESWQKISTQVAYRVGQLVEGLQEIAPEEEVIVDADRGRVEQRSGPCYR
jgi:hypothetical protein